MVVPSVFTHAQQDYLMEELQRELSRYMTRGGLQGERGPAELPPKRQRCSQGPEEEYQALETRQQER